MSQYRIWTMLAVLALSPVLILAAHAAVTRMFRSMQPQKTPIAAAAAGYVPAGILLWFLAWKSSGLSGADLACAALYAFLVYTCVAYSYFHLFNMSETARRIRIMREIYQAGSLTAQQIIDIYNAGDMVEVRLERLADTGQIELKNGRYFLKSRLLYWAAQGIEFWRFLLGFRSFQGN